MYHRIASTLILFAVGFSSSTARADVVTDWNQIAVQATKDAGLNANTAPRALAIVHIAIHDTLAAIDRTHAPYQQALTLSVKQPVSRDAAAIGAAHYALSLLFPALKPGLTARLTVALDKLPDSAAAKKHGVELGVAAADGVVGTRTSDGAGLTVAYAGSEDVGKWRPTAALPGGAAATPQWATLKPFSLTAPAAFRPAPPPAVNSATYLTDLAEVRALGAKAATTLTAEVTRNVTQTQIAKFWENATHLPFFAIARQLSKQQKLPLADNARLFAQLSVALSDSRVAAWDAKYEYGSWRPVTAIVTGDGVEDDGSSRDAEWVPYLATPAHPEYPSGHSTTGAAGATVLAAWFGDEVSFTVSSDSLAETSRSFTSLWTAALENGRSRIYGGIHFQYANAAGLTLGKAVGQKVVDSLFLALPTPAPSDAGTPTVADAGAQDGGVADAGVQDAGLGGPQPDAGNVEPEPLVDAGNANDAGEDNSSTDNPSDDSSCSVAYVGAGGVSTGGIFVVALAAWLLRRRARYVA